MKIFLANINEVGPRHIYEISNARAEKARRYKQTDDQKRCVAAGLLLEKLFPKAEISQNEFGKPFAKGEACFNISHSGDYVAIAVSGSEVGCDIEKHRDVDVFKTGRFVCNARELDMLENSDDAKQDFFDLWTKKESLLKCMGKGFHRDAKSVDVSDASYNEDGTVYYFKTFRFSDYTLSVCSTENNFPRYLDFIRLN